MAFFKKSRFVSVIGRRKKMPDGLWLKCGGCAQAVYRTEVEENQNVCPACGHHYKVNAAHRIEFTVDEDSFKETHQGLRTADPLKFSVGKETYLERVERAKRDSGQKEALVTGYAAIEGTSVVLGVMEPGFIMASMGSVVGEKFCRAASDAARRQLPFICFCASGGARMQEGTLALMQMAKTADAVRVMNEAGVPYISVLTDATTGGVYASFASLGDITLAEPGANIGFAGRRVIEGALNVQLPDNFQTAEYQFNNGFIDQVVPREDMRATLGKIAAYLTPQRESA